jgi:phosphatidylethanolamine/phosphatidyl-N-methylethanolamine N-methyltransferase
VKTDYRNRLRYNLYAPFYDAVGELFSAARREALNRLGLVPGEKLLVIGCGTGLDLDFIPPGVEITGLDVSAGMLARARRRAARISRTANLVEGDARSLPFADGSFDAITLHLILAVAPDPEIVALEAARVLRPGGRISVFDKFLTAGSRPGALRSILNTPARLFFSDLNRQVEPLLRPTGLQIVSDSPAGFGGRYRRLLAIKP